jgi:alkaline phosphatase
MNLRNQLLALFCLLVFIGGGVIYFHTWVVQRPFGIILIVGDGLVTRNLTAARLYNGGADRRLTMDGFPHLALVTNYASDFAVPDSPAAASAIATGVKVDNGCVSIGPKGQSLISILQLARQQGRATGIVSTGPLTDASIAAFYAHEAKSGQVDDIALQFAQGGGLDVALGGGAQDFLPEAKGGRRRDARDLMLEMKGKGAEIMRSKADLENAPVFTTAPRVGIFANGDLAYSNQIEAGSQEPSLPDMVRRAIQFLELRQRGYMLVVDAELISRAAGQNDGEHVLTETLDMDRAIATALQYAGNNSVVIAVGKHGTGGMTLNGYPLRQEHGVGLLGVNAFGYPAIAWATGPNGPQRPAMTGSDQQGSPAQAGALDQPAAFYTNPTSINDAEDVIAIGRGPGTDAIKGVIDNTEIFQILKPSL